MTQSVEHLPRPVFPPETNDDEKIEHDKKKPLIIWLRMVQSHAESGSSESRKSIVQLKNTIPSIEERSETLGAVIHLVSQLAAQHIINFKDLSRLATQTLKELGTDTMSSSPPIRRSQTPVDFK